MKWYGPKFYVQSEDLEYFPNEVLLVEVNQLGDANLTRRDRLRRDLSEHLGVDPDGMPPDVIHHTPGMRWNATFQAAKDRKKIRDICDEEYDPVRRELVEQARMSSRWIRETFIELSGVRVSNRDHFKTLLQAWMDDPCSDEKQERR